MLETRTLSTVSVVLCFVLYDVIIQIGGSNTGIFVTGSELNDVAKYIRLYVYSRNSGPHGSEIVSGNLSTIASSSFSIRKNTKLLVHGWFDNINGYFEPQLRKAYLKSQDVNVIAVDWSKFTPVARWVIVPVGKFLAQFVDWLVTEVGISVGSIHVIGFSLGAQLCGVIGEHVTAGRLGRITGLDPVGPTFGAETSGRLDASDAQFVDVIHTCGGRFGYFNASGHVDFYPNGGTANQPGCSLDFTGVCSHIRSYRLFVESISGHKFLSRKCGSWRDFSSGFCDSNFQTVMGEYVDHNARGNFYLYTAGSRPYTLK